MKRGSVFVMCSTVDPNWSVALEQRLAISVCSTSIAPISGGAAKAASGQMTMMTAGHPEAYDGRRGARRDAAKVYKSATAPANGSKVKIINQLLAGVHIAAAAEAMALGLREGVRDAAGAVRSHTHSAGNSWMFENRMAHVLAGDYTPCRRSTSSSRISAWCSTPRERPSSRCPCRHRAPDVHAGSSAGFGREDDAAVIKIFPGIELPAKE